MKHTMPSNGSVCSDCALVDTKAVCMPLAKANLEVLTIANRQPKRIAKRRQPYISIWRQSISTPYKPLLPTSKSGDLPEALVWEKSYVTINSDYAEAVRKLKGPAAQMALKLGQYFGGPGGNPDPKLALEVKAIYTKHFPIHANALLKAYTFFKALPAAQKTNIEKAILKLLKTMKPDIDAILKAGPTKQTPNHFDLQTMYNHMGSLKADLDIAYRALPEEVDAFAAGKAARKAFVTPKPARRAKP